MEKQKGFTLIEILVVVTIIGVLAGLVVVLIPKAQEKSAITECTSNVKGIAGILVGMKKFPNYSGPNMILYLVRNKDLQGERSLSTLFCPGHGEEFPGEEHYKDLDLKTKQDYGHLTSYAGRDQTNEKCRVRKGGAPKVLVADEDERYHNNKGFVCGYTDGSATFRTKVDNWDLDIETPVQVGEGSEVDELKCLRAE